MCLLEVADPVMLCPRNCVIQNRLLIEQYCLFNVVLKTDQCCVCVRVCERERKKERERER